MQWHAVTFAMSTVLACQLISIKFTALDTNDSWKLLFKIMLGITRRSYDRCFQNSYLHLNFVSRRSTWLKKMSLFTVQAKSSPERFRTGAQMSVILSVIGISSLCGGTERFAVKGPFHQWSSVVLSFCYSNESNNILMPRCLPIGPAVACPARSWQPTNSFGLPSDGHNDHYANERFRKQYDRRPLSSRQPFPFLPNCHRSRPHYPR